MAIRSRRFNNDCVRDEEKKSLQQHLYTFNIILYRPHGLDAVVSDV